MKVTYQGIPGAYSEAAIIQYWRGAAEPIPRPYLEDVFDAVEAGEAEAGLVPVENTIEGSITRTYDLLNERSLTILGETSIRIIHCLIANPGVEPRDIKRVYSHPQALAQARTYLSVHGYEPIKYFDTAGAVKLIRDEGFQDAAAVAGRRAAEIYGMNILAEGIETNSENHTRFYHVGLGAEPPTGKDKTSLAFTIDHKPGTLTAALRVFVDLHLNITKIESRPYPEKLWEYVFFIDFEGHRDDTVSSKALRELAMHTRSLKILGSYPSLTGH
jgi:chorismate mutase/prephenate dehydratase